MVAPGVVREGDGRRDGEAGRDDERSLEGLLGQVAPGGITPDHQVVEPELAQADANDGEEHRELAEGRVEMSPPDGDAGAGEESDEHDGDGNPDERGHVNSSQKRAPENFSSCILTI